MSSRAYKSIIKSFQDEAENAFAFMPHEFRTSQPERSDRVLKKVVYEGNGISYTVALDDHEMYVRTSIRIDTGSSNLTGRLDQLVHAANLGSPNEVPVTVHSMHDLLHVLQSQAAFLRRLRPFLTSDSSQHRTAMIELFRKADASEYRYRT